METKLKFVLKTVDGEKVEQEITCPPEAAEQAVHTMLAQYSQVGMLKRDGNSFLLLTAKQIATVEVDLPSIILANPGDTDKVAAAANAANKLITMS